MYSNNRNAFLAATLVSMEKTRLGLFTEREDERQYLLYQWRENRCDGKKNGAEKERRGKGSYTASPCKLKSCITARVAHRSTVKVFFLGDWLEAASVTVLISLAVRSAQKTLKILIISRNGD